MSGRGRVNHGRGKRRASCLTFTVSAGLRGYEHNHHNNDHRSEASGREQGQPSPPGRFVNTADLHRRSRNRLRRARGRDGQ